MLLCEENHLLLNIKDLYIIYSLLSMLLLDHCNFPIMG